MVSLDKINFAKADPEYFIAHLDSFSGQFKEAFSAADHFALPAYYIKINKVLLLGMGGSGIANDMIKDLIGKNIIVESVHDYDIPKWTDRETLVIACSYSGNTEEVIEGFFDAYERKAKIVAITACGKLKEICRKMGVPCFTISYQSPPRAALPSMFAYILSILIKLGHFRFCEVDFDYICEYLDKYHAKLNANIRTLDNPAKLLAKDIYNKYPVIFSSGTLSSVAKRFKAQINEVAKSFACVDLYPELNHNSIEGFNHIGKDLFVVDILSKYSNERIKKRQEITLSFIKKAGISYEIIQLINPDHEVAEVLAATLFLDYVSYYLSILYKENPTENKKIDWFKQALK